MRKCDKKVKKGQGKRRQSNKGNSNDSLSGVENGQGKMRQNNRGNKL